MNHRDILKNALRQLLAEKWQSFDGLTDQIERAADLVKQLGGLKAPEISDLDRAKIAEMIETQIGLGIERGDFDFVFRTGLPSAAEIGEIKIARLDLGPDDTIVFKAQGSITAGTREMIEGVARKAFPAPRKILVIDGDLELSIIRESTNGTA
jgi:hypothetical protein